LFLNFVHRGLQPILLVKLAHLLGDLRQQIIDAFGLFVALLNAFLHEPAHRLLQIAGVVHVVVKLIEDIVRIQGVTLGNIPPAIADVHHDFLAALRSGRRFTSRR
jgi:hypothetical protein